jgi:signal transduction histidine kinase
MMERDDNIEKLSKQQHLATIGQIAASIAHDIRNPLTSIQGFIQLIERQERRESYQEYYKIIRSEITRIDSLIREVLVLSKSHTMDMEDWEEVDLADLLQRLVTLMEPDSIKTNIEVELRLERNPQVLGSEEKLHQVFMNMIRNAFEAVVNNGSIRISLTEQSGEAAVRIQDTGTGIPENKLEYLFTPFFTTKEEGTGLGLSICQSIIKAHGGNIEARNRPGGGAEFTVTLPVKQAFALEEAAAACSGNE